MKRLLGGRGLLSLAIQPRAYRRPGEKGVLTKIPRCTGQQRLRVPAGDPQWRWARSLVTFAIRQRIS